MKRVEVPVLPVVDAPERRLERASRLGRTVQLVALAAGLALAPIVRAEPTLALPPFPENLDLSSVEGLYKSNAYRVEVRRAGTADPFVSCFVFETRNDWVYFDFFNPDPAKRSHVLRAADQVGNPKADICTASFALFSFADTAVEVRITLLQPGAVANTVTIRPLRHGHAATVSADGKTITFTLPSPRKISVEVNHRLDPLFLFADAPDVPDTTATHYFGPGLHRIPGNGTLTVRSNERVYLAAGAIVEGRFALQANSANITLRGRGILSRGEWPHPADISFNSLTNLTTIGTAGSHHLVIEGLTIVQSTGWQLAIEDFSARGDATHHNQYRNLKMVSFAGNTDGIWVTGYNHRVSDCFIFNNDDAFVCKGGGNTTITDCVVWGGPWGHLLLFHPILSAFTSIRDLTLDNIDLIGREGTPEIFWATGNSARSIHHITVRNVRIEERRRPGNSHNTPYNALRLLNFDAAQCSASFSDILFENVSLDQRLTDEGSLRGSAARPYTGITFKNLTMGGRLISSVSEANLTTNAFVHDVRFLGPNDGPGRLGNLSVRSQAGTGSETLIVGFVVSGAGGGLPVLVRGWGPELARDPFRVPGALADPLVRVFREGAVVAENDNWSGDAQVTAWGARVGAFAFSTPTSRDAALTATLPAGANSAHVLGVAGSAGVALAEIYDATVAPTATSPGLVNLSARSRVGTEADVLIAGFVVTGSSARTVLLRALGPALEPLGVAGALGDPRLELWRGAEQILLNDNWWDSPDAARVAKLNATVAFPLPAASRDAAILATLPPGAYSAVVRGTGAATGVGLVEIYLLP